MNFPRELKTVILSYCSQEKIVHSLPMVIFTLRSWDGALAQINQHQLKKGKLIIEINAEHIYGPESEQHWKWIIAHELTHLLHDYLTGAIRNYYSLSKKLDRAVETLGKRGRIDPLHEDLRILLFRLFRKIYVEGVAKYYENLKMGVTVFS
ncbi:hypothetical protein HYT55_04085 [Candidatus Woesearchaeota archaeon]|nr:hypothetical protein [Candidatus Woesearchaeota archaeon]